MNCHIVTIISVVFSPMIFISHVSHPFLHLWFYCNPDPFCIYDPLSFLTLFQLWLLNIFYSFLVDILITLILSYLWSSVSSISSGFPERAPDFRSVLRISGVCSGNRASSILELYLLCFSLICSANSVFYSFILANVKLTHARSLTTVKFQSFKRQLSSLEGNMLF